MKFLWMVIILQACPFLWATTRQGTSESAVSGSFGQVQFDAGWEYTEVYIRFDGAEVRTWENNNGGSFSIACWTMLDYSISPPPAEVLESFDIIILNQPAQMSKMRTGSEYWLTTPITIDDFSCNFRGDNLTQTEFETALSKVILVQP